MFDPTPPPTASACPFCAISTVHAPYNPRSPPPAVSSALTSPASYVVLSTPALVAFLDILPLSHGHVLLCPRPHRQKLTDVTADEAAELGRYLRVLSRAVARTTGVNDWNVIQNNGAAAAQVVPHMHYHIIPRPEIRASGRCSESFTMFGKGTRSELDDDEAEKLAADLRRNVAIVMQEEAQQDQPVAKL